MPNCIYYLKNTSKENFIIIHKRTLSEWKKTQNLTLNIMTDFYNYQVKDKLIVQRTKNDFNASAK